jgi:crotonobetainyl-CoA:carnitine CoA-transferase CaiB-like acyl-CoA transferase
VRQEAAQADTHGADNRDAASAAPLSNVTILDLSTRLPGPLATLMLAQAGARVIRIERPPHGEEMREFKPQVDGRSAHHRWLNQGKEIRLLDLREAADRTQFLELAGEADVLVEQFRPGAMERLGLGRKELQHRHPRLIWCSITGYGHVDPRSMQAAHDLNYQADAGLLSLAPRDQRGVPVMPTALLGDMVGGSMPAVTNILLALMQRTGTGLGGFVDIAMSRNIEFLALWPRITGSLTGQWPEPLRERHNGGSPRYNLYLTRDKRVLALGALEDRFWQNFLEGIDLTVPEGLERDDPQAVITQVAQHLATQDAAHWLEQLKGRDACCNLVRELCDGVGHVSAGPWVPGGPVCDTRLPLISLPLCVQPQTP